MIKTIHAWILHKQATGDTSVRLYLFTREYGLIQCLFKGGRSSKKNVLLQLFTPLCLNVSIRYNRFYINSVETLAPTLPLTGNALFCALYANEILYYSLKQDVSEELLFDAYIYLLNQLILYKDNVQIEPCLRRFEWTLLQVCGYSFSLSCEAKTGQPIEKHKYYQFKVNEGLLETDQGFSGAHIIALAQDDFSDKAYLHTAKIIMRMAIEHLLEGRRIHSRALFTNTPL